MINIEKTKLKLEYLGLIIGNDLEELKNFTSNDKLTLVDNLGYKYYLNSGNITVLYRRETNPNKFFHNNIYTYENINNYFRINNIPLELITKNPSNAIDILQFKCLIHNKIINRNWNKVKDGSIFCEDCLIKNIRDTKGVGIDKVRKEWGNRWDCKLISNKYINNLTKMQFICNKHSEFGVQEISWGNSLGATHICECCRKDIIAKRMRKNSEQFKNEIKEIHGNKYDLLSSYIKAKDKVKVHCNVCGNDFDIQASHLLEGHGCNMCVKSKGEEFIENCLKNININYQREYRFNDCIGIKRTLPFDFYLKDINMCIEYQGIQHYKPVEIFGGQAQFETQKINDSIKEKYCRDNDIRLLTIPYWEFNNIEEIINNKLNLKGNDD